MRLFTIITLCFNTVLFASPLEQMQNIGQEYCFSCHGPEKQKGKLRLDTLKWEPNNKKNLELWQEIAYQIEDLDMPPEDEKQLEGPKRNTFVEHIHQNIENVMHNQRQESVVLRRMNKKQYENTIRDLLGIDVTDSPNKSFPDDGHFEGFDTVSESLHMSEFLMKQMLTSASESLDRATYHQEPIKTQHMVLKNISHSIQHSAHGYEDLITNTHTGWKQFSKLVNYKQGGLFKFNLELEGFNSSEEKFEKAYFYDKRDELVLGIYLHKVSSAYKEKMVTQPVQFLLVKPGEKVKYNLDIWIPHGYQVMLRNETAPRDFRPEKSGKVNKAVSHALKNLKVSKAAYKRRASIDAFKNYKSPRIRLHHVSLSGPHHTSWPPESHKAIYASGNAHEIIENFAEKAFRRPVQAEELEPYHQLLNDKEHGLKNALMSILCSPQFLYLEENEDQLNDYALASRISYFLWNSMPDHELMVLAKQGKLNHAQVLNQQVDRMLADPKSNSFRESFVFQWLHLNQILEMPPANSLFRHYHKTKIYDDMIRESVAFFNYILDKNLSLSNFIDSDFIMSNQTMSKYYNEDYTSSFAFKAVDKKSHNQHRGGLLGQAAILTASSNGVETSPIIRGIWVLENLLGTPPSPPPEGIEIPEPDIRGAKTVKEILNKHRNIDSCNDCHRSIDPIGFALENFDPVGIWRTHYPVPQTSDLEQGPKVDTASTYQGQAFNGIVEMKSMLMKRLPTVEKNIARKLLIKAVGRDMGVSDKIEIGKILERLHQKQGGLKDLVKEIVNSKIFTHK